MNGYENQTVDQKTIEKAPKKRKVRLKRWVYNALFVIAGIVFGEVTAALTQNIPFLSWLSYKVNLGITNPCDVNLVLVRFQIGFCIVLNPALVIFVILALAVGNLVIIGRKK